MHRQMAEALQADLTTRKHVIGDKSDYALSDLTRRRTSVMDIVFIDNDNKKRNQNHDF